MNFLKNHSFISQLPADPKRDNSRRQVKGAFYSFVKPKTSSNPKLVHVSQSMMEALDISNDDISSKEFLNYMTGNAIPLNTQPYSMVYAGHQFGNWAGQLGDGRAINLGEIEGSEQSWIIQLKGAGETPYSRSADGLAVLRSSIREYLCSEAMHKLGVPTTRALSLALTGDKVLRDMFYDGHPEYEDGAIVSRVAKSFLRFGNFELFAWHSDVDNLRLLADYSIRQLFPTINSDAPNRYLQLFDAIVDSTLNMIVHWQRVGFVHGVMNTDNMSILGLTIDYGPYGWLEGYDPNWTPNTTDNQFKRYRFGNQPNIALWNLYKLANAFYPLIEEVDPLQSSLDRFSDQYAEEYLSMMRSKLGLTLDIDNDKVLIGALEEALLLTETDYTIFFRNLSAFKKGKPEEGIKIIKNAFYKIEEIDIDKSKKWQNWFKSYSERLNLETITDKERADTMNTVNPKYVLRNYMAQIAIDKADDGDYSGIKELYQLLMNPYSEQPKYEKWFARRPEWARHKAGCSMLSCSS